jgi:hypothetical protein
MNWKGKNLCFCDYKRNSTRILKWIETRPDTEDCLTPCSFCIISTMPDIFEQEWNITLSDLPDIYCSECKLPKKSEKECLQESCK